MIDRRRFLQGILAAGVAPRFIRSETLMGLYVPSHIEYTRRVVACSGDVINAGVTMLMPDGTIAGRRVAATYDILRAGTYQVAYLLRNGRVRSTQLHRCAPWGVRA